MRDIDKGEWKPVPNTITFTVLIVLCAVDFTIIGLVVCFFRSKGWL
jgi:hypothetical protein